MLNGVICSCHQNLQTCLELSIIKSLLLLLKSSVSVKIAGMNNIIVLLWLGSLSNQSC